MEGGASFVTIERVAERSGVAKTTIYRHWDSRSQVLFDAFAGLVRRHTVPTPEGEPSRPADLPREQPDPGPDELPLGARLPEHDRRRRA
ncbi:MAG: helix-turn-helix transcriptional regulator [Thermoflexaceae bacterium]|nr:helix-turn-helix transcriptional regulator [Thermoflexaceae bacterium]